MTAPSKRLKPEDDSGQSIDQTLQDWAVNRSLAICDAAPAALESAMLQGVPPALPQDPEPAAATAAEPTSLVQLLVESSSLSRL